MHSLTRIFILIAWLLGALIGARAQSSSSGGPTAGSSISGRVMLGGNPAPGLMVGAQRNDPNAPTSSSEPAAKATTNQDGRYQITGLAPGRYRVMSLSTVYVVPGDGPIASLSGRTVTLNENDQADNIDFSVVRGAVITGKVLDGDGRPLIGERVTVTVIDDQGRKRPTQSMDFTMNEIDDRGVYRVFGLPAGRYTVSAGQATDGTSIRIGFGGPTYRRTFHPNAIEEEQAKIIELREGQEVGNADIAVGRPVRTFEATGRIVSAETGQPMPNVMFGYGGLREGTSRPSSFGSSGTPTNIRGEFRIDNLLPGRYAAFLYSFPGLSANDAGTDYYSDPVPFEISDGNVSGIEIRVHRAGSITGVIAAEDGNDQALLSQAAQAFVFASPVVSGPAAPPMPMTSSSSNRVQSDGSFRVSGLSPGKLRLMLNGSGLQLVRIEREGSPLSDGTIELTAGEQVSGLRLIVSYGTGVVRGEVKLNGTLDPGMRLMVSARRLNVQSAGPPPTSSAEADARGRFLLEKLAPGEYELTARVMPGPNFTMMSTTMGSGGGTTTVTTTTGTGTAGGPPAPPLSPAAMPSVKQNVTVANGTESQVTMTLDLSGKK